MTGMRPDRHKRVQEVFVAVMDLPRERWEEELTARCADDAEVLAEVRSLLGFHDKAEEFLDAKEIHAQGLATLPLDEVLKAGTRIGEYTIQRLVGAGGMGHVYVAEQDRPRRTVALKVIRRGLAGVSLLRRFEHEAEMLGRLQHPGIAQIHEAGAAVIDPSRPAQPFIAMELVSGPSLTAYADLHRCDMRARLELVAKVCDAVHHAHQRGVIHRDLKPANILVTEGGQPKVLDFGVARAADADLRVTTMQTSVGQLIGTLPYMSPEQVIGDPAELDTRSDVYALGVVTYELLTGRLPYELKSRALPEAVRLIRDEPPARMSTINRTLRGDVDTIVNKALAKEKARRYQSAAELGADIRAFLDGRPIAARQDSALYVLQKQMRRHKGAVAAAAVIMVGVLGFAVYAIFQARTSRLLEKAARDAQSSAESALVEAREQRTQAERQLRSSTIERGRLLGLSGNPGAAEELLWPEYLKDLGERRTFFALWELYSHSRCEATLRANDPEVYALAQSLDGHVLATSGREPAIITWNVDTLERLATFGRSGVDHRALVFSADGDLVSGDQKGNISFWNPRTGAELAVPMDAGAPVLELAVDRTGTQLAAALEDGSVLLLDGRPQGESDRVRGRWKVQGAKSWSLAFSPTADVLAIGCRESVIKLVSVPGLTPVLEISNPDDPQPALCFSPDGSRIAAGGGARRTRIWDAHTGEQTGELLAANGVITGVAYSPGGGQVLCSGWWSTQLWDASTFSLVETFSNRARASRVLVSPDGGRAWFGVAATLRAWELNPQAGQTRLDGRPTRRTLARFAPSGGIVSGDGDGSVWLLSDPAGTPVERLAKATRRMRTIAFSPTASIAAALGVDGVLYLLDLDKHAEIGHWRGFKTPTNHGVDFDPTGTRMVVAGAKDSFKVLEVPSGREIFTLAPTKVVHSGPGTGEALCAVYSPDGRTIATVRRYGTVSLHDASDGSLIREFDPPGSSPWTLLFTPDGKNIVAGNWSRSIDVWDVATGRLLRRLDGHRGLVTDLAFRPGEPTILASCAADGRIMLWDLSIPENTPVLTLEGLDGWELWALDFDHTGRRLMATNGLGLSVIWDLRYFNRHIGGNMPVQIEAHRAEVGDRLNEPAAMEQIGLLLNRGGKAKIELPSDDPTDPPK
jgi:WD40 repeat protein